MPQPLGLSDSQYDAVVRACEPLLPQDRDGFLRALAAALRDEPVIGDGTLHRAVRALQREFWRPPQSTKDLVVHRQPSGPAIE